MRKLFYFSTALICIISASSCTKKCTQCSAVDKRGVTVNVSNKVCEPDFSRKKFEKRYEEQFKDYTTTCVAAD